MKTTFAASLALAAMPLASATFDIGSIAGLASLPKCASGCMTTALTSSNCGIMNFKCLCSSDSFLSTALKCLESSCNNPGNSPVDHIEKYAQQAVKIAQSLCSSVGITLPMPNLDASLSANLGFTVGANGAFGGTASTQGSAKANGNADANANANANASNNGNGNGSENNNSGSSDNSGNNNAQAEASASVAASSAAASGTAAASDAASAASSVASVAASSSTTCTTHDSAATGVTANNLFSNGTDAAAGVDGTVTAEPTVSATIAILSSADSSAPVATAATDADAGAYITIVTSSCSMVPVTSLIPVKPSTSMAMVYNQTVPSPTAPAMFTGAAVPKTVSGAGLAGVAAMMAVVML